MLVTKAGGLAQPVRRGQKSFTRPGLSAQTCKDERVTILPNFFKQQG